ncbi:MAG: membrane protein insertion efficiency factor YidD [bacterium]|nr:membrane protein insertion efficiency factor YidD [bacterium]
MNFLIIRILTFYQKIISIILKNILGISTFCRFSPTCSEYAKQSVNKYGVIKGLRLSIVRIVSCQPFSKK